jgi:tetratricopeptide (TPR) repeat protein
MRFCLSSPLATVLFILTLHSSATLPALGRSSVTQPTILIASIESKIDEFITEGNRSLAKGDPATIRKSGVGVRTYIDPNNPYIPLTDNDQAMRSFDQALRLDPKNRDALFGKGLAILQKRILSGSEMNAQVRDAIDYFSAVTQMPSGKNFAPVYLELGEALLITPGSLIFF